MSAPTPTPVDLGFRIFVIGAGFSRPAGLPLATELYQAVRAHIEGRHGTDTKFDGDVEDYLEYCDRCGIAGQTKDALDLEQFMSYLDIEHYMQLRGSKAWSTEGNEAQLMIRKAIGAVIHDKTPKADKLPDFYYRFAEQLRPGDTVLTFNYDLVIERALSHIGKPFRRFPYRYKAIHKEGGTLESDNKEVVLLKLHGSLDWFDDRHYIDLRDMLAKDGHSTTNLHSVFDNPARYGAAPLVDSPLPESDGLHHIHAIRDVDGYYASDRGFNAPFILSPSHLKFVYAEPLFSLWNGMGRSGAWNLGFSVLGFSLPAHDEYIRVGLYKMLSNYESWWDQAFPDGSFKDFARFVDYRTTKEGEDEYMERYTFANADRSRFFFGGVGQEAIDFLFKQPRTAQKAKK